MKTKKSKEKNTKIGSLGEQFIQARLVVGMSFDEAWQEWRMHEKELAFILNDCPQVRSYDNRYVCDAQERLRLRQQAKKVFGPHIKSADVSRLAGAAMLLKVRVPRPRYRMDQEEVRLFLREQADVLEMQGNIEAALTARSEEFVEHCKSVIEAFADEHSLWAVPPNQLLKMWGNHLTSYNENNDG